MPGMEAFSTFDLGARGALEVQIDGEKGDAALAALCHEAAAAAWPCVQAYSDATLPWTVAVRLGGEAEGRMLNRDFRHKDYATNVLSFPADESEADVWHVGDIFICLPVLRREAAEQGKEVGAHLQHLVVHGMLHLVGYDHERGAADAAEMEGMERRIMADLGLPDPYGEDVA